MIYFLSVLFYTFNGAQATDLQNGKILSCKVNITNLNNENVNLTEYCSSKPCIPKCCGRNEVILYEKFPELNKTETKCTNVNDFKNLSLTLDYVNLKIYKSDVEKSLIPTTKDLFKDFNLVQNKALLQEKCGQMWTTKFKAYLLENGNFATNMQNYHGIGWRIKEPNTYCVDRMVLKMKNKHKTIFAYYLAKEQVEDMTSKANFAGAAMLVSSFFLFLVLLVYCVLPQLRNLSGMLLMAYVATLFLAYLMKAVHIFNPQIHFNTCAIISPIIYFLFLSSILWLNIMSFDIWWTFRGMRLKRAIHRQGEIVKFLWYGLYAWGVAFVMTISAVLIDRADSLNGSSFIKPSFDTCLRVEIANALYLYTPISILTLVNIILFLMTVYNMWIAGKILNNFNSSNSSKKNQSRFRLYIKMSLVMGVSWALEVVQAFYDFPLWIFIIVNLYNSLIGVPIFLLFIFNKSTLIMLCKRFNIKSKFIQDLKLNSSTRSTVSRSRSSTNKSSYTKTKVTEESEMFETEDSTVPSNNIEQPKQSHL